MKSTDTLETAHLQPAAKQAWSGLEARVAGVQTRHRATFLSTGFCVALAVIFGAFLGFSAGDILFKFSISTRVAVVIGTLLSVVVGVAWQVLRPWRKMGGSQHVAANVERTFPQLENQLSTALEYGRNPELSRLTSSPALVSAMIQQAASQSQACDFTRTVRWRPVMIAVLVAFFFIVGVVGYATYSPRLFKTTLARFMSPTADIAAPTLTVIRHVTPGNSEVSVESNLPVEVGIEGVCPESATISVFIPETNAMPTSKAGHWEDRPMERGTDGIYRATLRRLLETTRYKISAGDDCTNEFSVGVFKIPEIINFTLRLDAPSYTGKSSETLAPDVGDVRALKGTTVHIEVRANTELTGGQIQFKSGRTFATLVADESDSRKAMGSFVIEADDEYQFQISNSRGMGSSSKYLVKALKDRAPKVVITQPDRDMSAHREQTVTVEISAEDDVGVREIGIFHSMGLEENKTMIRKFDPTSPRATGKLVWELGRMGLKGGEVIAYYAYALDNDTINGKSPKMSKSEIHFLTIYDEEAYDSAQMPKDPKDKTQGTPPAVKQIDKLIDLQKKVLKESFAQARIQKSENADVDTKIKTPTDKAALQKTFEAQKQLQAQVQELYDTVKKEVESKEPTDPSEAKDPHGSGPNPSGDSGLGEKELKHMERALEKMGEAQTQLKIPDAEKSVQPEIEALRSLSQTRKLLLSNKDGDSRFKMAMNKQSKKNQQRDQQQQQQDQQSAKEELAELPKMMDRQKETEREAEHLSERKRNNPPPENNKPQTEAQKKEQSEQRTQEQALQKELEKLAKESEERTRKLERLAKRNAELQTAVEKMQQAADKTQQAASEAKTPTEKNLASAHQKMQSAENATRQAQRELRNAMDKHVRQEISNVQKDAQELATRQQDVADQLQQIQKKSESSSPSSPTSSKPDGTKPNSEKQEGSKSAKSEKNENSEGAKAEGSQEQRLKELANQQRDLNNDLQELSQRVENLSRKAAEKGLAGAEELDKARQQTQSQAPAAQAGLKSQEALSSHAKNSEKKNDSQKNINLETAQSETQKAAKAFEQLSQTLKSGQQKTAAGDMKAAASVMQKLQSVAQAQADLNKELQQQLQLKQNPALLSPREEQIANDIRELTPHVENLEVLRQNARDASTKDKLDEASKQARSAQDALKSGDAAAAKSAGESTEKSLNQALTEMERATGKTLEEKAREAQSLARSARENQERAVEKIKSIPTPKAGEKLPSDLAEQRDEAASKEAKAARETKRLEQAINALRELAQDVNPVAAEAAQQGKELLNDKNLARKMEDLAKDMACIGNPEKTALPSTPSTPSTPESTRSSLPPAEAAKQGEQHALTLRQTEKQLDNYLAEAVGTQLDKLRNMEQASREAALKASKLTPENKTPLESFEPVEKELDRLAKHLEKLEATALEKAKLSEAREALTQMQHASKESQQKPSDPNAAKGNASSQKISAPAHQRLNKALDEVTGGIVNRIERLLRAREVHAQEDEDAPKEYRSLVDQYYRALSDDMEGQ